MPTIEPHPRKVAVLAPIKGERTRYAFTGIPGLQLDCIPNGTPLGSRLWRVRYYVSNTRRTDTLGSFNQNAEDFIPLARAKDLAAERRRIAKVDKADPRAVGLTFDKLLEMYADKYGRQHRKSWSVDEYLYKRRAQRHVGKLVVTEISKRDLIDVRDKVARVSTGGQGDKAIRIISGILTWAEREALIETNPARGIVELAPIQKRDRVLTDDEVKRLWVALDTTPKADVIRLLLLTGQRLSEVCGITFKSLTDNGFEIARDAYKTGVPHFIPLSTTATQIIEARRGKTQFVFPGIVRGRGTPLDKPMSRHTPDHYLNEVLSDLKIADAAIHDLRRTVATNMAAMGVPQEFIDRVQGHVIKGVGGTYNRHHYGPEKRCALALWEARLLAIVTGAPLPTERW